MSQLPIFSRGPLTDYLLDYLEDGFEADELAILVGDAIAPKEGGWTEGQPGRGEFKPYVVLQAGPITPGRDPAGVSSTQFTVSYTLHSVGGMRVQADWVADKTRRSLALLVKSVVALDEGQSWKIEQVSYPTLGGATRRDQSDPPTFDIYDTIALLLERRVAS